MSSHNKGHGVQDEQQPEHGLDVPAQHNDIVTQMIILLYQYNATTITLSRRPTDNNVIKY